MEQHAVSDQMLERLTEQVVQELQRRLMGREQSKEHTNGLWKSEQTQEQANGLMESKQGGEHWHSFPAKTNRGQKKRLLLLGSLNPDALQNLSASFELVQQPDDADWELLLAAELSVCTMSEVAHGLPNHAESACILKGLLCGRPIFLLEQGLAYRTYRARASKPLYSIYQEQEDQLKKMGIRPLNHYMDLLDEGGSLPAQSVEEGARGVLDLTSLSLLREADLIRARTNGYRVLCLRQKTKITPLASDYIKNHSLTILRQ